IQAARSAGPPVRTAAQAGGGAPPPGAPRRRAVGQLLDASVRQVHGARRRAPVGALLCALGRARRPQRPPPPVVSAPSALRHRPLWYQRRLPSGTVLLAAPPSTLGDELAHDARPQFERYDFAPWPDTDTVGIFRAAIRLPRDPTPTPPPTAPATSRPV